VRQFHCDTKEAKILHENGHSNFACFKVNVINFYVNASPYRNLKFIDNFLPYFEDRRRAHMATFAFYHPRFWVFQHLYFLQVAH